MFETGGPEGGEKSQWSSANVIYVPYCTSDAWAGNAAATDQTWGFAFRGALHGRRRAAAHHPCELLCTNPEVRHPEILWPPTVLQAQG